MKNPALKIFGPIKFFISDLFGMTPRLRHLLSKLNFSKSFFSDKFEDEGVTKCKNFHRIGKEMQVRHIDYEN